MNRRSASVRSGSRGGGPAGSGPHVTGAVNPQGRRAGRPLVPTALFRQPRTLADRHDGGTFISADATALVVRGEVTDAFRIELLN